MRKKSFILTLGIMLCTILVVIGVNFFARPSWHNSITNQDITTEISSNVNITQNLPAFNVLVFSKTAGFRHQSIPAGIAAIRTLGRQNNFRVEASEDATLFTNTRLSRYQAVIFLNTTGDILNTSQ